MTKYNYNVTDIHNKEEWGVLQNDCELPHIDNFSWVYWARNLLEKAMDINVTLHDTEEDDIYHYHGDHLGSASWITDWQGFPVQYIHYLPYGEIYDNQIFGYNERFKFTGKELDEETGYYYFIARYLHSVLGFLSPDPLLDKYPGITSYAYCHWNPLRYVDPYGRDDYDVFSDGSVTVTTNPECDRVFNVNDQGQRIDNGLVFDYGSVEYNEDSYLENGCIAMFGVSDLELARSIFEYISKNSIVEWGMVNCYKENNEHNYTGTTFSRNSSGLSMYMYGNGMSVCDSDHLHPGGSTYTSDGDRRVHAILKDREENVVTRIYTPLQGYIYFDEQGKFDPKLQW